MSNITEILEFDILCIGDIINIATKKINNNTPNVLKNIKITANPSTDLQLVDGKVEDGNLIDNIWRISRLQPFSSTTGYFRFKVINDCDKDFTVSFDFEANDNCDEPTIKKKAFQKFKIKAITCCDLETMGCPSLCYKVDVKECEECVEITKNGTSYALVIPKENGTPCGTNNCSICVDRECRNLMKKDDYDNYCCNPTLCIDGTRMCYIDDCQTCENANPCDDFVASTCNLSCTCNDSMGSPKAVYEYADKGISCGICGSCDGLGGCLDLGPTTDPYGITCCEQEADDYGNYCCSIMTCKDGSKTCDLSLCPSCLTVQPCSGFTPTDCLLACTCNDDGPTPVAVYEYASDTSSCGDCGTCDGTGTCVGGSFIIDDFGDSCCVTNTCPNGDIACDYNLRCSTCENTNVCSAYNGNECVLSCACEYVAGVPTASVTYMTNGTSCGDCGTCDGAGNCTDPGLITDSKGDTCCSTMTDSSGNSCCAYTVCPDGSTSCDASECATCANSNPCWQETATDYPVPTTCATFGYNSGFQTAEEFRATGIVINGGAKYFDNEITLHGEFIDPSTHKQNSSDLANAIMNVLIAESISFTIIKVKIVDRKENYPTADFAFSLYITVYDVASDTIDSLEMLRYSNVSADLKTIINPVFNNGFDNCDVGQNSFDIVVTEEGLIHDESNLCINSCTCDDSSGTPIAVYTYAPEGTNCIGCGQCDGNGYCTGNSTYTDNYGNTCCNEDLVEDVTNSKFCCQLQLCSDNVTYTCDVADCPVVPVNLCDGWVCSTPYHAECEICSCDPATGNDVITPTNNGGSCEDCGTCNSSGSCIGGNYPTVDLGVANCCSTLICKDGQTTCDLANCTTYNCSGTPDYNCSSVVGNGGTYATLTDCTNACSSLCDGVICGECEYCDQATGNCVNKLADISCGVNTCDTCDGAGVCTDNTIADSYASSCCSPITCCDGTTSCNPGTDCPVCGCTDSGAANYNASATYDDGSCTYYVCGTTGCSGPSNVASNPGTTFATELACQTACKSWNCNSLTCNEVVGTQGTFTSEALCNASRFECCDGSFACSSDDCLVQPCNIVNCGPCEQCSGTGCGSCTTTCDTGNGETCFDNGGGSYSCEVVDCRDSKAINYNSSATAGDNSLLCEYRYKCEGASCVEDPDDLPGSFIDPNCGGGCDACAGWSIENCTYNSECQNCECDPLTGADVVTNKTDGVSCGDCGTCSAGTCSDPGYLVCAGGSTTSCDQCPCDVNNPCAPNSCQTCECDDSSGTATAVYSNKPLGTSCGNCRTCDGSGNCTFDCVGEEVCKQDPVSGDYICGVMGCKDPLAINNDESLQNPFINNELCKYEYACNTSTGSCYKLENPVTEITMATCEATCQKIGCTDPDAYNTVPGATIDDPNNPCEYYYECVNTTCTQTPDGSQGANPFFNDPNCGTGCAILGCTDETAQNYNPNANVDDGSCNYYWYCEDGVCYYNAPAPVNLDTSIDWKYGYTSEQECLDNIYTCKDGTNVCLTSSCFTYDCDPINCIRAEGDNGQYITDTCDNSCDIIGSCCQGSVCTDNVYQSECPGTFIRPRQGNCSTINCAAPCSAGSCDACPDPGTCNQDGYCWGIYLTGVQADGDYKCVLESDLESTCCGLPDPV